MSLASVLPNDAISAYFLPDTVVLRVPDGTYRAMSYQSLLGALTSRLVQTPFLPPGTRYYASASGKEHLLLERPPGRFVLTFSPRGARPVAYSLPLPTLLAYVVVSDQHLYAFNVYAAANYPVEPHHPLYHCPLPNVSTSGSVCFGAVQLPRRVSVSDAGKLLETFLSSPFNLDYTDHIFHYSPQLDPASPLSRLLVGGRFRDVVAVYNALQDYAEFPVGLLRPMNLTVTQLFSQG